MNGNPLKRPSILVLMRLLLVTLYFLCPCALAQDQIDSLDDLAVGTIILNPSEDGINVKARCVPCEVFIAEIEKHIGKRVEFRDGIPALYVSVWHGEEIHPALFGLEYTLYQHGLCTAVEEEEVVFINFLTDLFDPTLDDEALRSMRNTSINALTPGTGIATGLYFKNGQLIAPPYTLTIEGEILYLNNVEIQCFISPPSEIITTIDVPLDLTRTYDRLVDIERVVRGMMRRTHTNGGSLQSAYEEAINFLQSQSLVGRAWIDNNNLICQLARSQVNEAMYTQSEWEELDKPRIVERSHLTSVDQAAIAYDKFQKALKNDSVGINRDSHLFSE